MKKFKEVSKKTATLALALIAIFAAFLTIAVKAKAGLVVLTPGYVTYPAGSTNLPTLIQVGTITLTPKTLFLQNNGLANTNQCIITGALTFDGTNFFFSGPSTGFPVTNAGTQFIWNIGQTNYPVYASINVSNTAPTALSAAIQQ